MLLYPFPGFAGVYTDSDYAGNTKPIHPKFDPRGRGAGEWPTGAGERARDEVFLRRAIELAKEAEAGGEVPVGAVAVVGGVIVGEGFNSPRRASDPTAHAEILALRAAAAKMGNYRLEDATLYVTLEPCPMCAGAVVAARLRRLVFGSRDLRFGGVRSKFRIADSDLLNHRVEIDEGILGAECQRLLEDFFRGRR